MQVPPKITAGGGLDPKFGCDTEGGTSINNEDQIVGIIATCPESGVADSISVYLGVTGDHHCKCALYDSSGNLITNGVTEEKVVGSITDWITFNFVGTKPTLSAQDYIIVVWAESAAGSFLVYWDAEVGKGRLQNQTYNSFPDPVSFTTDNYKRSIYCTYTTSRTKTIMGNAAVSFRKYKTLGGNARVKVPTSKTIAGNAKVKVLGLTKTIQGNAAVSYKKYKEITGTAAVDSIQRYDTPLSYRFDRDTVARAIAGVANSVGYEWWIKSAATNSPTILRPVSDGSIKQYAPYPATPTTRYDKVDEETADEDSTYNYASVVAYTQLFSLEALSLPTGAKITKVVIKARAKKIEDGARLHLGLRKSGQSPYYYFYKNLTADYADYSEEILSDPYGGSWTVDKVNSYEWGFVANMSKDHRITQFWLEVHWVLDILCFMEQRGRDKSATITLEDDIMEIDQTFDATKIINKLTVVGMGPGSSHLEVTVNDTASQQKYGIMEGVFSEKDIHDIDTLTAYANAALEQTVEAKHRMIVKLIGTPSNIELGDIVHVTHTDAGIDDDYRIISMEVVSGVSGEYTKLEIAVPQFKVTETLLDVKRRIDAEDYHPQGAPSILTLARADNVDSTHSLKMKFYIPPEAVDMGKLQIKEAKIALTLEKFRAYSTGAASGGGHTSGASSEETTAAGGGQTTSAGGGQTSSGGTSHAHTVSGQTAQSTGSHRHIMFHDGETTASYTQKKYWAELGDETGIACGIFTNSSGDLYTYGWAGTHSHTVTGTTSSSESAHTHDVIDHAHDVTDHTHGIQHTHEVQNHTHGIVYGIYESTYPADVYIKLNGEQIAGPYNADEYIDITTEFLNEITTYGWNTLEFTTTQNGKIGATLFMRLFLQAS